MVSQKKGKESTHSVQLLIFCQTKKNTFTLFQVRNINLTYIPELITNLYHLKEKVSIYTLYLKKIRTSCKRAVELGAWVSRLSLRRLGWVISLDWDGERTLAWPWSSEIKAEREQQVNPLHRGTTHHWSVRHQPLLRSWPIALCEQCLCTGSWKVCVSVDVLCLIACDLGPFTANVYCVSVETDSVKKRPVALLLKLL